MMAWVRRIAASGFTHVAFAFFMMGGWAFYANSAHAMPKPLVAAVVQGTLSGCITLFLKTVVEWLSVRFEGIVSLVAPPIVACTLSLCILVLIHKVAATPELFATIALPFSVASLYAIIYNFSLWRLRRSDQNGG